MPHGTASADDVSAFHFSINGTGSGGRDTRMHTGTSEVITARARRKATDWLVFDGTGRAIFVTLFAEAVPPFMCLGSSEGLFLRRYLDMHGLLGGLGFMREGKDGNGAEREDQGKSWLISTHSVGRYAITTWLL